MILIARARLPARCVYRGVARIFQRWGGGGGSHCVTHRVLTGLSCRHPRCFTNSDIFFGCRSRERGEGGGGGET